jgi:hypothetical protein
MEIEDIKAPHQSILLLILTINRKLLLPSHCVFPEMKSPLRYNLKRIQTE